VNPRLGCHGIPFIKHFASTCLLNSQLLSLSLISGIRPHTAGGSIPHRDRGHNEISR
jgi:hypothetical protein